MRDSLYNSDAIENACLGPMCPKPDKWKELRPCESTGIPTCCCLISKVTFTAKTADGCPNGKICVKFNGCEILVSCITGSPACYIVDFPGLVNPRDCCLKNVGCSTICIKDIETR